VESLMVRRLWSNVADSLAVQVDIIRIVMISGILDYFQNR